MVEAVEQKTHPTGNQADPQTPSSLAKEERSFLHDVASPLSTLNLVLETTLNRLQDGAPAADIIEKLKKAQTQVERINTLLRSRREILVKRSE